MFSAAHWYGPGQVRGGLAVLRGAMRVVRPFSLENDGDGDSTSVRNKIWQVETVSEAVDVTMSEAVDVTVMRSG